MKQTVRRIALVVLVMSFIAATLAAQDVKPKRGRLLISVFGGYFGGAPFLSGYTGNPIMFPNDPLIPEFEQDSGWPLYNTAGTGMYGFSLGYSYGFMDSVSGRIMVSIYAEYSYCPTVKFKDGTETLTHVEWNQAKLAFVDVVTNYPQTGRKAGMSGVTLGTIVTPFKKLPLGLDLGFGYWRYRQEYVSGTLKSFQNADLLWVTGEPSDTQLSYGGDGKLERNSGALTVKIGFTYRLTRFLSLDATWRSIAYFHSHGTNLVYVESGEGVTELVSHSLADLFTLGITFGF
jgi:hypothetical protein